MWARSLFSSRRGQRDICALNNAKVERIENGAIRSVGWLEAAVNGDYPTGTSWQYATDV
jgi:hypothetical protein